jgi:hypothetical protein
MKIPPTIKFLGHDIKVRFAEKIKDENGNSLLGYYNDTLKTITISSEISSTTLEEVFWHELTHAIDINLGLGLGENKVQAISSSLHSIIKNNKCLLNKRNCK